MYSCRLIMLEGLFSLLFYCESGINQYAGQKTSIDVFGTSLLSRRLGWLRYIGLFQKQRNRGQGGGGGGWRKHFFENSPGIFRFFTLPLEISDKLKIQPLDIESIVLHLSTLEILIAISSKPLEIPYLQHPSPFPPLFFSRNNPLCCHVI